LASGIRAGELISTAKKARVEDLGHAIKPAVNGDGHREQPRPVATPIASPESAFPPIADYAFLSDCEINCLIAPSGRVEWMCLPRPDSPSVFAASLDRAAGSFRFGPTGVGVPEPLSSRRPGAHAPAG